MNIAEAREFITGVLEDYRIEMLESLHRALSDGDAEPTSPPVSPTPIADVIDVDAVVSRAFEIGDDGAYTLPVRVTRDEIVWLAQQHEVERAGTGPTDLPCPGWCDDDHGHTFSQYLNALRRNHVHRFGDRSTCVALELRERTTAPIGGVSDLRTDPAALLVRLHISGHTGYLTGAGARRLATQLLEAADIYEAEHATITGHGAQTGRLS